MAIATTKKLKLVLVKNSNLNTFISQFAEKCFVTNQSPNGSFNACILWCIKYGLARDREFLVDTWEDLPPLRMRRIDTQMHSLYEKSEYSVYMDLSIDYELESILKVKRKYEQLKGTEIKVPGYPKFRGLKRNVVINCIKLVMIDMCEYVLNSGEAFSLDGMMKYYGVEVK